MIGRIDSEPKMSKISESLSLIASTSLGRCFGGIHSRHRSRTDTSISGQLPSTQYRIRDALFYEIIPSKKLPEGTYYPSLPVGQTSHKAHINSNWTHYLLRERSLDSCREINPTNTSTCAAACTWTLASVVFSQKFWSWGHNKGSPQSCGQDKASGKSQKCRHN